jgi:hypothetical protein
LDALFYLDAPIHPKRIRFVSLKQLKRTLFCVSEQKVWRFVVTKQFNSILFAAEKKRLQRDHLSTAKFLDCDTKESQIDSISFVAMIT